MRYTFFLYSDETLMASMPPEAQQASLAAFGAYIEDLKKAGAFVATDWLHPSATATTLTLRDGKRGVQDGPYADTKEQLGGLFMIEAPDLDGALAWAEKCPVARFGFVEVRPSRMGG
jgi:hypothetical protein